MENPVGRPIRMGELSFTVIGVFRERAATYGLSEIQKESVIIPHTLMKYYMGTDVLNTIYAQTSSPDLVNATDKKSGLCSRAALPLRKQESMCPDPDRASPSAAITIADGPKDCAGPRSSRSHSRSGGIGAP